MNKSEKLFLLLKLKKESWQFGYLFSQYIQSSVLLKSVSSNVLADKIKLIKNHSVFIWECTKSRGSRKSRGTFSWVILVGQTRGLFSWVKLVDHSLGSNSWIILVGQIRESFSWVKLVGHSRGSFSWVKLVVQTRGSFSWVKLVGHSRGLFSWIEFVGNLRLHRISLKYTKQEI